MLFLEIFYFLIKYMYKSIYRKEVAPILKIRLIPLFIACSLCMMRGFSSSSSSSSSSASWWWCLPASSLEVFSAGCSSSNIRFNTEPLALSSIDFVSAPFSCCSASCLMISNLSKSASDNSAMS